MSSWHWLVMVICSTRLSVRIVRLAKPEGEWVIYGQCRNHLAQIVQLLISATNYVSSHSLGWWYQLNWKLRDTKQTWISARKESNMTKATKRCASDSYLYFYKERNNWTKRDVIMCKMRSISLLTGVYLLRCECLSLAQVCFFVSRSLVFQVATTQILSVTSAFVIKRAPTYCSTFRSWFLFNWQFAKFPSWIHCLKRFVFYIHVTFAMGIDDLHRLDYLLQLTCNHFWMAGWIINQVFGAYWWPAAPDSITFDEFI